MRVFTKFISTVTLTLEAGQGVDTSAVLTRTLHHLTRVDLVSGASDRVHDDTWTYLAAQISMLLTVLSWAWLAGGAPGSAQ